MFCARTIIKFQINIRAMSSFTQVLNPMTGRSEWQAICDDYDYHQEVSNAAFADMLHDTERNEKYFAALKKVIGNLHKNGKKANVLDIGTGTGILSMMAVVCGADTVTACEAFLPMADCAEKIIEMNGMSDKIKLIKKRSTDIKVGEAGDMKTKANVLVTEVFDTELIGEGAIGIFNHAHDNLLTEDSIVIPQSSTTYAQIIESPLAVTWNKPKLLVNLDGELLLKPPLEINECQGECAVHDIQLSQIALDQFDSLVDPFPIFEFNWGSKTKIEKCRTNKLKLSTNKNGIAQVVFFWWDLKMDPDGEIVLSCAPFWAHPDFKKLSKENPNKKPVQNCIPWRDHWMQALYYLPKPVNLKKDEEFYFSANHDEYSYWFDAWLPSSTNDENSDFKKKTDRLKCTCSLHLAYSRSRIGQINNHLRNKKYLLVIEDAINKNSNVLVLSDGSLIGLSTAAMGAKSVVCLEPHSLSRDVIESFVKQNQLENVKIVKSLDDIKSFKEFTHIIGEPNFITSILPWDNFYFGTLIQKIKNQLNDGKVELLPMNGKIFALPVEFLDLHKIRSPLNKCEGFDLSYFDKFIEKSTELAVSNVEAQPLWEYPCRALSDKQEILQVQFREFDNPIEQSGSIDINVEGMINGIALWVDWDLNGSNKDKYTVSTGPTKPIEIGNFVSWDMYVRQGVHFVPTPKSVTKGNVVKWNVIFKPNSGDLHFKFNVV